MTQSVGGLLLHFDFYGPWNSLRCSSWVTLPWAKNAGCGEAFARWFLYWVQPMHLAAMYLCGSVDRFNMFELAISRNGCWYRRVVSMPKTEVWLLRYGPRMYAVCCKESSWLGKEAFSTIQAGATGFLLQFNQQKAEMHCNNQNDGDYRSFNLFHGVSIASFGYLVGHGCRLLASQNTLLSKVGPAFWRFVEPPICGPKQPWLLPQLWRWWTNCFWGLRLRSWWCLGDGIPLISEKKIYQQVICHHHAGRPGFAGWN